jgi:hypothetical protein
VATAHTFLPLVNEAILNSQSYGTKFQKKFVEFIVKNSKQLVQAKFPFAQLASVVLENIFQSATMKLEN